MAQAIKLTADGLLLNWLKDVGDSVKAGEIIAEIEADKATVEIEAPADGVLLEQSAEVGDELEEGAVIGSIGDADEAPADDGGSDSDSAQQPAASDNGASGSEAPAAASNGAASGSSTTPEGRIKASPVAKNIAEERGIDLAQVSGSGPGGRIVKADVENFDPSSKAKPTAQPAAAPASAASAPTWGKIPQDDVEVEDISRMRKAIADGTINSFTNIPHFYINREVDVEPLLALRKQINAELESEGVKVSVNDMILKATALALKQYPNLNSHYYGDKIVRHQRINIGIAVALPNNGLVNVVAHDADQRSLSDLAVKNKAMFNRAREGKIKPADIKNATFTISNLGPYDVEWFSAIISAPEAGIIAIGAAKKKPVVLADGTLGVGTRMSLTLSIDHRVSDGAEGAQFMQLLKDLLENPMRLLV